MVWDVRHLLNTGTAKRFYKRMLILKHIQQLVTTLSHCQGVTMFGEDKTACKNTGSGFKEVWAHCSLDSWFQLCYLSSVSLKIKTNFCVSSLEKIHWLSYLSHKLDGKNQSTYLKYFAHWHVLWFEEEITLQAHVFKDLGPSGGCCLRRFWIFKRWSTDWRNLLSGMEAS